MGRRRDEGQREAPRQLGVAGDAPRAAGCTNGSDGLALARQGLRQQLALARRGGEAALRERRPALGHRQPQAALALQPLEGHALQVGVVPLQGRARHLLVALAQGRVLEAHPRCQAPEELGVRQALAQRLDGRAREAQAEVAVGLVQVVVLEGGGGRQQHVGEVGRVGLEQVVHDHEQVFAQEAPPHGLLVGGHRAGVRVVDEQGRHRRVEPRVVEQPAQLAHVERAGPGRRQVGPLERGRVDREGARGRQQHAAARVAPGSHHRRQAGDGAHRHAPAGVAVEAVVQADGRGVRRAYSRAKASISAAPRPVASAARPRGPLAHLGAQLVGAQGVALEVVAVLEPVAEDHVHHAERQGARPCRAAGPGAGRSSRPCASDRDRR